MERKPVRTLLFCLSLALPAFTTPLGAAEVVVLGLFKGKAVLRIDGNRHVLSEGETSPEGVTLVAADSEGAVLEFDGRRQRHALGTHIGSRYEPAKPREVRIWPDTGGMYTVSGAVNGFSVSFMVDTGATFVSMNSSEAKRLGIDYLREGQPAMMETASGHETAYRVNLDAVTVGEIRLRNVPAVVLEGTLPRHTLLGMSFLERLDMQRDGRALILRAKW